MIAGCRLLLCITALLGMVTVGCGPQTGPEEGTSEAQLLVTASQALSAADVTRVQVEVSAADMPSHTVALVKTGSRWGGVIKKLPAGSGRTFKADAFNSAGVRLYAGEVSGVTIVAHETAVVSITLQELAPEPPFENAAPVITSLVASPASVEPGGLLTLAATATDANAGDALIFEWTAPSGTFASASSLSTSWTAPSSTGAVPLTLTIIDSKGASATVTLAVQVRPKNGSAAVNVSLNTWPQVINVSAFPTAVDVGESAAVMAVVNDMDGDALTYAWSSSCEGTWEQGNSDTAFFTPTARPSGDDSCGPCPLTVSVQDGKGGVTTGTLTICVGPKTTGQLPPEVVEIFQSAQVATPGGTLIFRVKAIDPQDAALSFDWTASTGSLGAPSTGAQESEVSWTAPACAALGSVPTVTVTVSNALGLSAVTTFELPMEQTCSSTALILGNTPYTPGGPIAVQWFAPAGHSLQDWVGLFKVGAPNTTYVAYQYVPAGVSGTLNFVAPAAGGSYEFRYLRNNGYTDVAASSSAFTLPTSCSTYSFSTYRGQNGTELSCWCGANPQGSVWGTDIYTDDSNACRAAVHAGVIPASGGNITVRIMPGQSSYTGSTRNGITTTSYGVWSGSFSLVSALSSAALPGMTELSRD